MHPATIKVKPWAEGHSEFVVINECDFDEKIHTLYEPDKKATQHRSQQTHKTGTKGIK
ncbi:MAG: hypothetical protein GY938_00915 [Ketobacter sp.]|nr:hypothetical protein [Ketobacter sp.]